MSASTKLLAGLTLGAGLFASVAYAASEKLDEANANTAKAIVLLKESPAGADDKDAHRKKAIDLLTRAQSEILKAKGE
ncbi:MAG TPA: hypothetical protein VGK73_30545 [Polyangiaceae bacterium]